jgi:hypothetical protein
MSRTASQDPTLLTRELAGLAAAGPEAWSARLGYGSNLFVDLGERRQESYTVAGEPRTREIGSWSLWVSSAAWRIEDDAHVIVACEDPRPAIAERIPVLQGRRITAVSVTKPALQAVFDFDGVRLLVFPAHSSLSLTMGSSDHPSATAAEHGQWSLWRPEGDILSVLPDSTWTTEPSRD